MLSKPSVQYNLPFKKLLSLLVVAASLFFTTEINASHLLGGDLTYEKNPQTPGQIRFRLTLYGDPMGIPFATTEQIRVIGATTTYSASLISTSFYHTTCSDSIKIVEYQTAYFTLPAPTAQGTNYYWSSCCRPPGITNLVNPDTLGLYLPVQIRSYSGSTSFFNSPRFLASSNFVVQANATSQVSFAADDPDGDSLYYSLASAREFTGTSPTSVPYAQGHSFAAPFDSTTTAFLDPRSGLLTIVNPKVGNYTVVVRVESYSNGQLMGRVFREQNIKVIGQAVSSYQLSTAATNFMPSGSSYTKLDSTHYVTVSEGNPITINFQSQAIFQSGIAAPIVSMGLQGTQNISVQNGGSCNGAGCIELTGNLQDTTMVSGILTFIPPIGFVDANLNSRFVTLQIFTSVSDWCGGESQVYETVVIRVKKATIWATQNTLSRCPGDTAQATILGDVSNLVWSPAVGVSNIYSATPKLYPPYTTTYTVTNLNDNSNAYIQVDVVPDSARAQLYTYGINLVMRPPYQQNSANWFYNGFGVQNWKSQILAMNGTYWNLTDMISCMGYSDTIRVDWPSQSALEGTPNNPVAVVTDVDTITFNIKGTGAWNSIERFFIVLDNGPQTFSSSWLYKITDLTHNTPTLTGTIIHDGTNNRLIIGSSLNLSFDGTHEYKVSIYSNLFQSHRFRMYERNAMPFQDEKGVYQITQTETETRYSGAYSKYHLPLVVSFVNEIIGIKEEGNQVVADVFPNPVLDVLHVQSSGSELKTIILFDLRGRTILEERVTESAIINVAHIPAGVYVYRISGNYGYTTGKLVKL